MNPRPLILLLFTSLWAHAHPMGNFSISHYTRLEPKANGIELTYALDVAEIPTFELLRGWKLEGASPRAELEAKALEQARIGVANLAIAGGAGNLPMARITAKVRLAAKPGRLTYEDRNYPDRAGWKEIVITPANGMELRWASHSRNEVSQALTAYPADPAVAPPRDMRAQLEWRNPPAAPAYVDAVKPVPVIIEPLVQPNPFLLLAQQQTSPAVQQDVPGTVQKGDSLSQLLRRGNLGFSAMLLALALAFGFGAVHALSPGHGKTIVAAYLVGSRGTFKHALFLGAMVTFTHTVSVFLLGLGTLYLSKHVVPDKIYPILGTLSGLTIVFIGGALFFKRLRGLVHGHSHAHDHGHRHDHDHEQQEAHKLAHAAAHADGRTHTHPHTPDHHHSHEPVQAHDHGHKQNHPHHDHAHATTHSHSHHHGPGGHSHMPEGEVTLASLVGLAVSGGMVPCPSALVLLLSSIALGQVGFGLLLLTSFSLGLSLILIAIGCAVLYAKHLLPDTPKMSRSPFFTMLPVISAAVITIAGLFMTAAALGIVKPIGI